MIVTSNSRKLNRKSTTTEVKVIITTTTNSRINTTEYRFTTRYCKHTVVTSVSKLQQLYSVDNT